MTLRREVTEARRVVVKVGSSSLTTAAGHQTPFMKAYEEAIKEK